LYNDSTGNLVWSSNIFASNISTTTANLGNLYIIDETIYGKISNRDITLSPAGSGAVSVPSLKIPTGTIIQGNALVAIAVANVTVESVLGYSTSPTDALPTGTYGIPNGVAAPYTVYKLTSNVSPNIVVNDHVSGTGVPFLSNVVQIGTGLANGNANVFVVNTTLNTLPNPPGAGTILYSTRDVVNSGFNISTLPGTDIDLVPGAGGSIITSATITPFVDAVYDLGTPARRWKHVWVGAGTIYILDETLGTDQSIGARDGNLYIGGGTGLTVGKFTLYDNTIALANPTENFYIGSTYATGNLNINRPLQVINSTGNVGFQVDRNGITVINTPLNLSSSQAAFNIVGSSSGYQQPRNFANTMIQVTGQDNAPNRVSFDAFGVTGAQNSYVAVAARVARGTVTAPGTTQAGDTILRFTGQGWTGNGTFASSIIRLNLEAAETFTSNSSTGTRLTIQTTPIGSNVIQTTAAFYSNGLNLYGSSTTTGVTFVDNTFQNTAWVPANNIQQITVGVGFTPAQQGVRVGNIGLDTVDVHSVASASYSLTVANITPNSQNLRLTLAQEIGTNSSPTFSNVTVNGNLYVAGNIISQGSSSLNGKILYLANNSATSSDIVGGGIQLGANGAAYSRVIKYSLTGAHGDYWYTDTDTGFQTEHINATDIYMSGNLFSNGSALFGGAYTGYSYPNAGIQVFQNTNSYAQIVEQNISSGTQATTDFVATANNGTDTVFFVDLGIAGSNYDNTNPNNSLGTSLSRNDSYLYAQGNTATTPGGNLVIGAVTPARVVNFIAGGINSADIHATLSNTAFSVVGNITATQNIIATGNVTGVYHFGNAALMSGLPVQIQTDWNQATTSNIAYIKNKPDLTVYATVNQLTTNVNTLTTSINSLISNAAYQEGEIGTLQSNAAFQNTWLSNLQANVGTLQSNASFQNTWLSNLQSNVTTIDAAWQANAAYQNTWIGNIWTGFVANITPTALASTVHIAAVKTGNVVNIVTDATTANVANTIVVRNQYGTINVSGWVVGTKLTAVDYTATSSDYWIGTTAKGRTITLPNADNGAVNGRQYQIADTVHSGNPNTTIAAQSPATVVGNQPSQQGQIIIATYVGTTWYLN
jgi:hypothetical protein